jgi:hypothetical protein
MIKLTDIVQIEPSGSYASLDKQEKHKLMDSVFQNASPEKRGLLIHFGLSNSGRRINNRIYTPKGQIDGAASWTQPFPKPIILNHNREGDPLGRFTSVRYVSTEDQAVPFFKKVSDFMEMKDSFIADDPKKIYRTLKKFGLLTDKRWPGLGRLEASARITDESAVEKFLDGRYLTFSAGSHTDRYVCGICGSDWAKGDICDHRPGQIDTDGEMGIFVTGTFEGDEASVLNTPANDLSQIFSMEFSDSVDFNNRVSIDSRRIDTSSVYTMDAQLTVGEPIMHKTDAQTDEKQPETTVEVAAEVAVETDAKTEEKPQEQAASTEAAPETVVATVDAPTVEEDIDWDLLDLALEAEVGRLAQEDVALKDAQLSSEKRSKLSEDAFCGPNRSFPVPDCAHVTAARRLVGRAKLSASQKDKVLACVNGKAKSLGCDSEKDCQTKACNCDSLQKDYLEALKVIDILKVELETFKGKLEDAETSRDTIQTKVTPVIQEVKKVEDPSVDSSDAKAPSASSADSRKKVTDFEHNVLSRYRDIKKSDGVEAADAYIDGRKRLGYLRKSFDPKQLIEEI